MPQNKQALSRATPLRRADVDVFPHPATRQDQVRRGSVKVTTLELVTFSTMSYFPNMPRLDPKQVKKGRLIHG